MFSHTIGRGSTDPTIWFSTPSRNSQACTITVKSRSTAIMVSTFGCTNGLILSGARAFYAMARDGLFFKSAGELNGAKVPGRAG